MNDTPETCPHCGADWQTKDRHYICGIFKDPANRQQFEQSKDCLRRELAAKDAELNAARAELDANAQAITTLAGHLKSCQRSRHDHAMNSIQKDIKIAELKRALSDGDAARDRVRWDGDTNMIAIRAERDNLRALNAELVAALEDLLEEYTDREFQFGGDYLWQKHEDKERIEKARAAIARASTEQPSTKD